MAYLYETHLHTSQGSCCGKSQGHEYVKRYQDLGYAGIIVTDHFYHGNCAAGRGLPWDKWVHRFCLGYEDAREEGARRGLDVFFGWEETFDGDDYLVYGLDKEWLLKHPECRRWSRQEQLEEVRRYGGCVVQAHPFRQYYYISRISLFPLSVDAIEAANSGNEQSFDALAWAYAKKLGLPVTAGSDIHNAGDIKPYTVFGVYLEKKMKTIGDYASAIRNNTVAGLSVPEDRFTLYGDERISLPVEIRDNNERNIGHNFAEFLNRRR